MALISENTINIEVEMIRRTVLALAFLASLISVPVGATTLVVTTTADLVNGDTSSPDMLSADPGADGISLREAFTATNNVAGPHTITFASALAGQTIALTQQLPLIIQDHITLTGLTMPDGQPNITIDASQVTVARATIFVRASYFVMVGLRLVGVTSTNSALHIGAGNLLAFGAAPQTVTNIRIEGNSFSNDGITASATGISVATDPGADGATIANIVIARNTFNYFRGDGDGIKLQAGGSNCLIQDVAIFGNTVSQTTFPVELVPFNGSNSQIRRIQIEQNTFTDNHQAISIGTIGDNNSPPSSGNLIEDTLIARNVFSGNTGQSIALNAGWNNATGNSIIATQIVNNLIVRTGDAGAIFVSGGSTGGSKNRVEGVSIVNDTIVRQGAAGQSGINVITNEGMNNSVTGVTVLNTILWGNSFNDLNGVMPAQVSFSIVSPSTPGFAGINGNLDTDPNFVNPGQADFHLQPGSPAINLGSRDGAPALDLDCHQRDGQPDIGAFEFGSQPFQMNNLSTATSFGSCNIADVVVEFYNTNLDHYFITADTNEAAGIDSGSAGPGWSRTGYSFNSGGSTSVCRFYGSFSPGPNSHFYTVDPAECQGLKDQQIPAGDPRKLTDKSWNFESLDFVSTVPTTGGLNGTCLAGTAPVYRAYNNGFAKGVDSNHRITSSLTAIQEVVARGWSNEGVVMCAPN